MSMTPSDRNEDLTKKIVADRAERRQKYGSADSRNGDQQRAKTARALELESSGTKYCNDCMGTSIFSWKGYDPLQDGVVETNKCTDCGTDWKTLL